MRVAPAPRAQVLKSPGVIPTEALDQMLKAAVAMRIGQPHNARAMQVLSSSYEAGENGAGSFTAAVQGANGAVYTVSGRYELGLTPRLFVLDVGGLGPA